MLHKLNVITIVTATFILAGCLEDPARDHPLDPLGDNFKDVGRISLRITNFYPPREGLENISISLLPVNITGMTDEMGVYETPELSGGSYTVIVEKNDFARVDTLIEIQPGEVTQVDIALAGLPTFKEFKVTSLHLSRWFPPPEERFSIEVVAGVDDVDGEADIDSLWLSIPEYAFSEYIPTEIEPGVFLHTIPEDRLPVPIDALIGQELQLEATDRSGNRNSSVVRTIFRVIDETPLALEPDNLAVQEDSLPVFIWQPIAFDFPYSFRVDVVRVDQNIQRIIQTMDGIPSTENTIRAKEVIPPGDYFWAVSVVDEFGNRSRSREAGFRIQ